MTYGGKEWCAGHIQKVLMNEKYQGDTRFQKTYNADYLTKRRAKNKGELPQYYLKDSHPAIIDRETWSLVQLEFERQKQFIKSHYLPKFHQHNEAYPLSSKIFCQVCRHTLVLRESMRKADYGQKYWICKKFRAGRYGHVGPDACCNGQRIVAETVDRLLVDAWNDLVDRSWQETDHGGDQLAAYRIRDLLGLIVEYGHLDILPNPLLIRVLERIEVGLDGRLTVLFLAGMSFSSCLNLIDQFPFHP